MLKDLIDMRQNVWQGRRETEKAKSLGDLRSGKTSAPPVVAKVPQDARSRAEPQEWTTVPSSKKAPAKGVVNVIPKPVQVRLAVR